jgi:hypothetical protein
VTSERGDTGRGLRFGARRPSARVVPNGMRGSRGTTTSPRVSATARRRSHRGARRPSSWDGIAAARRWRASCIVADRAGGKRAGLLGRRLAWHASCWRLAWPPSSGSCSRSRGGGTSSSSSAGSIRRSYRPARAVASASRMGRSRSGCRCDSSTRSDAEPAGLAVHSAARGCSSHFLPAPIRRGT